MKPVFSLAAMALAAAGCSSILPKSADEACGAIAPTAGLEEPSVDFLDCRASHGDRISATILGTLYLEGEYVARDEARAAELFRFAGQPDSGYTPVYMAGFGNVSPQTQMVKVRPAEPGIASAQYELGRLYLEGRGVRQSDKKAKKWLSRAATQGHKGAQELVEEMERGN